MSLTSVSELSLDESPSDLTYQLKLNMKKFEKISSALERTLQISRIELERDLRHSKWLADNLQ